MMLSIAFSDTSSCIVISRLAEADKRNDDGNHIEYLAEYASDGKIIYIIHYPHRGNEAELCHSDYFSVARPHSQGSPALCRKEDQRDPPFLSESKPRKDT